MLVVTVLNRDKFALVWPPLVNRPIQVHDSPDSAATHPFDPLVARKGMLFPLYRVDCVSLEVEEKVNLWVIPDLRTGPVLIGIDSTPVYEGQTLRAIPFKPEPRLREAEHEVDAR